MRRIILKDKDLIGYWPLRDNCMDYSGYGAHGRPSKSGLKFTGSHVRLLGGTEAYINVPATSLPAVSGISMSAWFRVHTLPTPAYGFVCGFPYNGSSTWRMNFNEGLPGGGASKLSIAYYNPGTYVSSSANLIAQMWYHVVAVCSQVLFINGVNVASVTNAAQLGLSGRPFVIGQETTAPSATFDGDVKEVRLYKRVLSSHEVSMLYYDGLHNGFTQSTPRNRIGRIFVPSGATRFLFLHSS